MEAGHVAHWSDSARVVAFRDARASAGHIIETGCSKAGLEIMLAKGLPLSVRVSSVPLKSAILLKQEAISSGGDAAYSASVAGLNAESTDVVILTSPAILPRLATKLTRQPFGLKRLAERLKEISLKIPARVLRSRGIDLPLGQRTYIMGILNATPDSFSDGGLYFSEDDAVRRGVLMAEEGADIIDIGGESTRPGSLPVTAEEEMLRVTGVVSRLLPLTGKIISVDTTKPEVAEECLKAGAHMINDVSGLAGGPAIARLCAKYGASLVIMHMRGTPKDMMRQNRYADIALDVAAELKSRVDIAREAGVADESLVLDPGFGFSKDAEQNIQMLRRLPELVNMGYPLLVGLSRKSAIGHLTGVKEPSGRMPGSIAAMTAAIMYGTDIVRVHDVAESLQAAKVADALRR